MLFVQHVKDLDVVLGRLTTRYMIGMTEAASVLGARRLLLMAPETLKTQ
jgi:hypothetical protein